VLGPDLPPSELQRLLELNHLRALGAVAAARRLEEHFADGHSAHQRLAVYGSLVPGRANHHLVAGFAGEWLSDGLVTGELAESGWGAGLGFPAFRWSRHGEAMRVPLLVSAELPQHWDRLDGFEGAEYLRILVPVATAQGACRVANIYAARAWHAG
jgi:gamma-glutamylcyclotransferase (GGCT)/AIG2-like uncharacterized protein YtfP